MIAATVSWSGTYALPATATPVAISVQVHGAKATVALGAGHAGATSLTFTVSGKRVRFAFPGLPQNVSFDGVVAGARVAGTVRQGSVRGTFSLRRAVSRILPLFGAYRSSAGDGVAIVAPDGLPPLLIELPSGATHGIGAALTVGKRLGDVRGNGAIAVDAKGFTWNGTHYARIALRQREVRVGADAATLTLPPGAGPFPGVVMMHGSGQRTRDEFDVFTMYLALNGVAVLADDKRGLGQSLGRYPGDAASESMFDVLARDAQAEARFLAALRQVDPKRVGLWGDSQAGWTLPLAASRERVVRFAIFNSAPTVTVGETDNWGQLAGQSESLPSGSRASMLAQVRKDGPSGIDAAPSLRKLAIPVLWMYGSDDRNVPTELCVERLESLKAGHDFSWVVLPTAHTPLVLPTGLLSSLPQSPGFDSRFFPAVADWLDKQNIAR